MRAVSSFAPLTKRRPSGSTADGGLPQRGASADGGSDSASDGGRSAPAALGSPVRPTSACARTRAHDLARLMSPTASPGGSPIKGASPARGGDKYSVEAVRRRLGGDDTSSPSSSNYDLASDEVLIDRDLG